MKRSILLLLLIFSSCRPGDEARTPNPPESNSSVLQFYATHLAP